MFIQKRFISFGQLLYVPAVLAAAGERLQQDLLAQSVVAALGVSSAEYSTA
jgi:hypothetical protein